jgi:hypothetical protein
MKNVVKIIALFALFGAGSSAFAITITNGSTYSVSNEFSDNGYDTNIFLNEGDLFTIYFNDLGVGIDTGSGSYSVDYQVGTQTIYGQIGSYGIYDDGTTYADFGDPFLITDQGTYLANYSGNLYLHSQDSARVPAPATAFLIAIGLIGLFVRRTRGKSII